MESKQTKWLPLKYEDQGFLESELLKEKCRNYIIEKVNNNNVLIL